MMIFSLLEKDIALNYDMGWGFVFIISMQIFVNYLVYIIPTSAKQIYLLVVKYYRIINNQYINYKIDYVLDTSKVSFVNAEDIKSQIIEIN